MLAAMMVPWYTKYQYYQVTKIILITNAPSLVLFVATVAAKNKKIMSIFFDGSGPTGGEW